MLSHYYCWAFFWRTFFLKFFLLFVRSSSRLFIAFLNAGCQNAVEQFSMQTIEIWANINRLAQHIGLISFVLLIFESLWKISHLLCCKCHTAPAINFSKLKYAPARSRFFTCNNVERIFAFWLILGRLMWMWRLPPHNDHHKSKTHSKMMY